MNLSRSRHRYGITKIEYPNGQLTRVSAAKDKCEKRAKGDML